VKEVQTTFASACEPGLVISHRNAQILNPKTHANSPPDRISQTPFLRISPQLPTDLLLRLGLNTSPQDLFLNRRFRSRPSLSLSQRQN
jgi:hypothetical protein